MIVSTQESFFLHISHYHAQTDICNRICLNFNFGVCISNSSCNSPLTWAENEIYQYNHPFASQLPQELATKMHKMTASPFAFYRGTDHIFLVICRLCQVQDL
ncbi:DUF2252 family protein [uncultured Nostoc sp.]|uniref:DUF2252 family protein n=1 Tax=uncultured Nostoc sp. TaxID=340711 RepID=UPI0035CB297B